MPTVPYQQRVRSTRRRLVDSLSAAEESVLNEVSASDSETCGANTSSVLGIPQSEAGALQLDQFRDKQGPVKSSSNDREAGTLVSSTLLRSRITYARQRSFLGSTLSTSDSELHGASASTLDGVEASGSSASLKHRSTPLLSADGEEHGRPVRSIHELRQAGDNARFQESVEALFDDFEDPGNPVSERCNGLIQLCSKLLEPDFMRRFLEYGFDERLAKSTVSDLDIISSCLALCAYRLVCLKGVYSYSNLGTFWTTLVDKSSLFLSVKDDIMSLAGNPRLHVSRAVRASLRDLIPRLTASMFSESPTLRLSPRLAILSCISICLTAFQDKSQPIQPISRSLLDNLIGLLPPNNGKATAYPLSYDDFQTKTMTLLVLESYLMLPATSGYEYNGPFHKFVLMHDDFIRPAQDDQGRRILTLYLRVVLNLTNNDPLACEQYAAPEIITGFVRLITTELSDASAIVGFGEHESFNLVILALGVLINLAEQSESCRASFLVPTHASHPPLGTLVHQFSLSIDLINHANSLSESHNNVAVGYLSILLALLCLLKEAYFRIQELLMECGKGIASVISTAKEFLLYHQKVERDSRLGEFQNRDNTSTAQSYYPTIENTFSRIIKYNGQDYATEIVDTAGQDEYSILNSKHFIGIHGYIIVYSVSSHQSFDMVRVIRDKILNHLGADHVPLVIVGNKSDLKSEQRQVSLDEGRQLGEEFNCAFTEASARLDYNVAKAFDLMIGEIERSQNPSQPAGGNKCSVM
ncbi:ras-domain-containing protein [Aspergillus brunneoviolaceus CBS 621.78]|uniref:Ras-domain-containing protein n=1 Tax=Aspergillus brunneoviolaceus CBS 621.78 TaxID=1450534 RepID=A0ACD1GG72_9EURO|nr:ras-domain-containing protein [Aspergillus brunneoviolaceus CBS 621.78]RAH48330.1 ras-domain-containing protein [Aspergillus brunneoviolaceus CBS 621.78]